MKQIKIRHWISIFLLPLAIFQSCNVEEIDRGGTPLPDGVTRLTATVGTGLKTRAVGDPLTGEATTDEKRIDRLAFFVHTDAEGMQVYEPAQTGETHKDFPNKVQLEPVDPADPSAGYTATVDLITGAGYEADIIAVANLPETYDYSQIVSWQGLLDSVAVGTFTTSMPLCTGDDGAGHDNAFVMSGSTTVALHKEKEETFNLSLERLTARIDITNGAYVQGMTDDDPKGGFLLTGVRILHARPQSYIMPQMDYVSPDVATVSEWKAADDQIRLIKMEGDVATDVTGGTADEIATATCQRIWHSLYTYENHETEHAPTGLEITGKFRGLTVTRQIPFEVTEADGTKRAVPIVRNHRYLVLIKPAPGQTDLTFSVQVGEWNAVDTVNVQPNQDQLPVITNVVCGVATKSYGGDLAGGTAMPDTIVVPADGGTLTFTASCPFDTRVTAEYFSPEDGNSWLEVTERSEATVTKGDISLARNYTITIKASADLKNEDPDHPDAFVNRAYLYIANGGNGSMVDTVTVYQGADVAYGETRFAGVTLGQLDGKELVWAPINVGATRIATGLNKDNYPTADSYSEELIEKDFAQIGYYYQWGRNVPFKFGTAVKGIRIDSPPTYQEACQNVGKYANLGINVGASTWFSDYTSSNLSLLLQDRKWPREYQPCPFGWHVPSKDEWTVLLGQSTTQENGIKIYGNGKLFIPAAGCLMASWMYVGADLSAWSSTYDNNKPYCIDVFGISNSWSNTYAFPIRCIKDN
ncbi:hypothetical protein [Parabacteroides sp.]